jgi:hypothetical protein
VKAQGTGGEPRPCWRWEAERELCLAVGHDRPRPPPWPPPDPPPWTPAEEEESRSGSEREESEEEIGDMPATVMTSLNDRLVSAEQRAYDAAVPNDHVHRKAGASTASLGHLTRRQATALHCLRLGRAAFTKSGRAALGLTDDTQCPECGDPVEDEEHLILNCPAHQHHRSSTIGNPQDLLILQQDPENSAKFLERCGRI